MYNTFKCHFKANQKSQSDTTDPVSILKGFFYMVEELVIESHSNLGIILLNKIFQELTKFKRNLTKVVLLR